MLSQKSLLAMVVQNDAPQSAGSAELPRNVSRASPLPCASLSIDCWTKLVSSSIRVQGGQHFIYPKSCFRFSVCDCDRITDIFSSSSSHIALLQLSYYGVALVLIVFTTFVAGQHPNAGVFLDWHNLRSDVTTGWTLGLCWMLDSLITVIPILLLIARSKLVLDFALTIHFINLLVTTLYTRAIPNTLYWWLVQICSAALMTSLGMWACQWRELQPMMFGGNAAKASPGDAGDGPEGSRLMGDGGTTAMGDTEERGRDGTVSYEMSGITPKEARNPARAAIGACLEPGMVHTEAYPAKPMPLNHGASTEPSKYDMTRCPGTLYLPLTLVAGMPRSLTMRVLRGVP
nr:protein sys1 [Quercus suber]